MPSGVMLSPGGTGRRRPSGLLEALQPLARCVIPAGLEEALLILQCHLLGRPGGCGLINYFLWPLREPGEGEGG